MLKWILRIVVTLVDIALLGIAWDLWSSSPPPKVVSQIEVPVAPEEIEQIIDYIGYDEDGGCLNDPACAGK